MSPSRPATAGRRASGPAAADGHPSGAPTLAVGLVGCGRLAEVGYLPAMAAARGVRLAAVADPDAGRREHLARLARRDGHPATPAADAAGMLERVPLDGLVLATPAGAHVADARRAARAGLVPLVEKPPAPSGPAAAALAALSPAPRLGFNRRFDGRCRAARAAAEGHDDLHVTARLHYRRRTWQPRTVADDALLDLGPHVVDLVRWISRGRITAVSRAALRDRQASFELELTTGRARLHCATNRPHREQVTVHADGRVLADQRRGGVVAGLLDRLTPGGEHPLVASLTRQLEAYAAALAGRPAPDLGTAADGVAVMAALDAVRGSAAAGGTRVTVTPPDPAADTRD